METWEECTLLCLYCNQDLPDDANFCTRCGRPQRSALTVPIVRARYEMCEIDYFVEDGFMNRQGLFGARELGTRRKHLFGESENFPLMFEPFKGLGYRSPAQSLIQTDLAYVAFKTLADRLQAAGWEPTGWGQFWYSQQFRRRVE